MTAKRSRLADPEPGAIDLLEESIHRLRRLPAFSFAQYYGATIPFVLALLYFWADFSRSADARPRAAGAAMALALLFFAMKAGQAAFADSVRATVIEQAPAPWPARRWLRTALAQAPVQATGLFVLPIAAVVTIPLGWALAFYNNATALGDESAGWEGISRAGRAAARRSKQNHAALAILSLFGLFAWLNLLVAVFLAPLLIKQITGEDNLLTRSGVHLFNSTFFAATFALVYLALDPLVKTFYTLRRHYFEAVRSGEDLTAALRSLPPVSKRALMTLLAAFALGVSSVSAADAPTVAPAQLGQRADQVLRRPEFAWRMPRAVSPSPDDAASSDLSLSQSIMNWLREMEKAFEDWWEHYFHRKDDSEAGAGVGSIAAILLRSLGWVGLALAAAVGAWLLIQQRRRLAPTEGKIVVTGTMPDPADESVLPSQLPEDEWLALASRLRARGEDRLALRALHLASLAGLARRGLVSVARHKSNRDYQLEFARRGRDLPQAPAAFSRNVRRFEKVWYGAHAASENLFREFNADHSLLAAALG